MNESILDYVKARVRVDASTGCWIWLGASNGGRSPRPYMSRNGRKALLVYRELFAELHGEIPPGVNICHTCDNGMCCNPAHLWSGTQTDNMRDCAGKGRHCSVSRPDRVPRGERQAKAKLTEDQVREIRSTTESMPQVAARMGIHWGTAYAVRRGKIWKHVT